MEKIDLQKYIFIADYEAQMADKISNGLTKKLFKKGDIVNGMASIEENGDTRVNVTDGGYSFTILTGSPNAKVKGIIVPYVSGKSIPIGKDNRTDETISTKPIDLKTFFTSKKFIVGAVIVIAIIGILKYKKVF